MSAPQVKVGPNLGSNGGAYELFVDGVRVAEVRKYEKRYNLRRVFVDRGWRLRTRHPALASLSGGSYDTRREAVEHVAAVLAAAAESGE